MGINVLLSRSDGQIVQADDVNQYRTSESGDKVPRVAGVPTSEGGSLGTTTFPWKDIVFNGLFIKEGELLDLSKLKGSANQIVGGKSTTDGHPDFLTLGTGVEVIIDTDSGSTPLDLVISTTTVEVDADISITSIGLAPSANNTCLINEANFSDQNYTKYIGYNEYGSVRTFFNIDTVGSEITSLDGTIQAFKKGSEIFLAYVDTTAGVLYPTQRGICGTARETLADDDTVTLLKANYIFLDQNPASNYITADYPTFYHEDITSPNTGQIYYNTSTKKWRQWDGSIWVNLDAILLGFVVCDDSAPIGTEKQDFDFAWDDKPPRVNLNVLSPKKIMISIKDINVAGEFFYFENYRGRIIDISNADFRDSGVSETADTEYFIYVTMDMEVLFSDVAPRKIDRKGGYYHPHKYYHCIGRAKYNSTSTFEYAKTLDYTDKGSSVLNVSGTVNRYYMERDGYISVSDDDSLTVFPLRCVDASQQVLIELDTATTIDVGTAIGTSNGAKPTGITLGAGWYYIFIIQRPNGSVAISYDSTRTPTNIFADTYVAAQGFANYRNIGQFYYTGTEILRFTAFPMDNSGQLLYAWNYARGDSGLAASHDFSVSLSSGGFSDVWYSSSFTLYNIPGSGEFLSNILIDTEPQPAEYMYDVYSTDMSTYGYTPGNSLDRTSYASFYKTSSYGTNRPSWFRIKFIDGQAYYRFYLYGDTLSFRISCFDFIDHGMY